MKQFLAFLLVTAALNAGAKLPSPYNTVKLLPFDGSGHFGSTQAKGLSYLIKKHKITTVVEIGSYLGKSTRFIAKLLPENGKVYAIDHWLGNLEWQNHSDFGYEQPLFYQKFLSNVIHEDLCHKVIPMKTDSLSAARSLQIKPDLVFIDGSHDYESVYKDITAWYPFVAGHGVLCGDDYGWGKGKKQGKKPVKKAVDQFAREHGLKVKVIGNWFWYYIK